MDRRTIMLKTKRIACLLTMLALLGLCAPGLGQTGNGDTPPEQAMRSLFERLQLSIAITTVAVYSPTLEDARLHATQILNLLRGGERPANLSPTTGTNTGLLVDIQALPRWIAERGLEPEPRAKLLAAVRNVQIFLEMARDASASSLQQRKLDAAARDLRRAYAYLLAAWGDDLDGASLPGLRVLVQWFGIRIDLDG